MMGNALRISATLLESFRRYIEADYEIEHDPKKADAGYCYCDRCQEADLVLKIKGEYVWRPEMRLGTSYHACLERPQLALSGYYEHGGLKFERNAVEAMLQKVQPGYFEVKTTKNILIAQPYFDEVVLVTKCDHISGALISEFKTTLDSFDAEKYLASYQWRLMMWLFDAVRIDYHVAGLKAEEDCIVLRWIESLPVFAYPQLEADCREMVRDFCDYLHTKNLDGFLRQKPATVSV